MTELTASLRRLLEKIAKENNFSNYDMNIKPISSGGANYSSQLFLATISSDDKELNLFAKVIIMGDKIRSQGVDNMFDMEPFIYTKLTKFYRQLEEKHNVPEKHRLEFPKLYGYDSTRGQEALVLEDLSAQGYSVYDRLKSVEWPYACEAIKELAKFHALSFAFQEEYPEEFEKAQKFLVNPMENQEAVKTVFQTFAETALSVVKKDNTSRLVDFISKTDMMFEFMEYLKPLRRTVLAHGDYRVSNLMHKVDHEGIYHLKILDYQTMKAGNPVADLLYFVFTGTDEEFRAKHYLPLLDHYYSQLSLAMRRLGLKPNEIYSRDDFEAELQMKLPYGLFLGLCTLPVVMVEEEDAPVMDKDKDMMAFKVIKLGKLYPERINGIINDYIKWNVL